MSYHEGLANRFFIFIILLILVSVSVSRDTHTVDKWAERIGSDLWDLADAVARPKDLKERYTRLNARVEDKRGDELIGVIRDSVGRMLRRKMDAVRCILKVAESAAENYNDTQLNITLTKIPIEIPPDLDLSYFSGKYSPVIGLEPPDLPMSIKNNSFLYTSTGNQFTDFSITLMNVPREMELTSDSHFYNIPVNTNYSSVHVPTNIYDLAFEVSVAIQWSKDLDEVFRQNYRSDPALSWQYFGSSTGILRQYPAMQWRSEDSSGDAVPDLYDCRRRSWFIESATCSKDMVILLDISGSMQGAPYSIGKATAGEILDTLSNNDFVTVLTYNNGTFSVVSCFEGMLVQATPENIKMFKEGLTKMDLVFPADLTKAFDEAFDILERYRDEKGCNSTVPCTQAIMLVTDGVPGNLTEVFDRRNLLENGTHVPVRIFTYLVGREVTNVAEIQWMACTNRGYYSHVHTLSEVREQVLKYIDVIARPLVLQEVRHPLIWTHAYVDISNPALATWLWLVMDHPEQKAKLIADQKRKQQGVRINEDAIYISKGSRDEDGTVTLGKTALQKYRLLTSVSIPAYDRKKKRDNTTRLADLLGVAGTDVPLDEINALTLPFKLGVNGYAFIVSNNGYVIHHPDLRPVFNGELKPNYNSIDLTEVEIIDDDSEPRQPAKTVLELRQALVNHETGNMTAVPVKFHYDDWRRVTVENHDYFYAPLTNTPFGIAIALPDYGTTWIKVGDEITKNKHMNVRILDFFRGDRWRVHPKWVYCRFHYLEGHEFNTTEEEMRYFLKALDEPDWYWAEQYEVQDNTTNKTPYVDEDGEAGKLNCGRKNLGNEAHYCNKELVQLLVFDANATNSSFNEEFKYETIEEEELGNAYGVFLRFVATQSGLTRWQNLREHPGSRKDPSSSEKILEFGELHPRAINEPWYKGAIFQHRVDPESISLTVPSGAGMDAIVTVAQGIFPTDGGKRAPAAVVGFQMPMISFYNRFINVTSSSPDSDLSCADRSTDCYLIDQNGYVIICDSHDDTGKFMGVIEGAVMGSMTEQGLFKAVNIYDYQALCPNVTIEGRASLLKTPLHHLTQILTWFFTRLMWLTSQFIELPQTWAKKHPSKEEDSPDPPPPPIKVTHNYPCDQKRVLYILQNVTDGNVITNITGHPSRPFLAQKVPHTNLVLVIVKTLYSSPYERLVVEPSELEPSSYGNSTTKAPCHKLNLNKLPRRGLEGCYTDHKLEKEIKDCGSGSRTYLQTPRSAILLVVLTIFLALFRYTDT